MITMLIYNEHSYTLLRYFLWLQCWYTTNILRHYFATFYDYNADIQRSFLYITSLLSMITMLIYKEHSYTLLHYFLWLQCWYTTIILIHYFATFYDYNADIQRTFLYITSLLSMITMLIYNEHSYTSLHYFLWLQCWYTTNILRHYFATFYDYNADIQRTFLDITSLLSMITF